MVRADDVFPIKYYDAHKNLMRNLRAQEEREKARTDSKRAKLEEIIQRLKDSEASWSLGDEISMLEKFRDEEL